MGLYPPTRPEDEPTHGLRLTAAQIKGTTALLRPDAVGFAPALGLLLFNASPLVGNLRWAAAENLPGPLL